MRISRTQFLRGDFSGQGRPIRPPWSVAESDFIRHCTRCDACVRACPAGIVTAGRGGFPQVDFRRGECTFCGDCVRACAEPAMSFDTRPVWSVKAAIEPGCVSLQGVVCSACGDVCGPRAIRMACDRRGIAQPLLDTLLCNGCGACVAVCPAEAIVASAREIDETEVC